MATDLPTYDPTVPAQAQDADYDCSQESAQWMLRAYGRNPDDAWMTQSLIENGVMTPQYGLMDASGAGMVGWLNQEYGGPDYGYLASNEPSVSFDDVALEAATGQHPLMIGGRAWYHWVGCRGFDGDVLLIANSAEGYMGVTDWLSRGQFEALGPFSMVRLTHPAAEGLVPPPALDYSWWAQDGKVGSGLLGLMAEDNTLPAQDWSTWLPLGRNPAQIEECIGRNGVRYVWLLVTNEGFRYRPQ
jgi:hypothetical protein